MIYMSLCNPYMHHSQVCVIIKSESQGHIKMQAYLGGGNPAAFQDEIAAQILRLDFLDDIISTTFQVYIFNVLSGIRSSTRRRRRKKKRRVKRFLVSGGPNSCQPFVFVAVPLFILGGYV